MIAQYQNRTDIVKTVFFYGSRDPIFQFARNIILESAKAYVKAVHTIRALDLLPFLDKNQKRKYNEAIRNRNDELTFFYSDRFKKITLGLAMDPNQFLKDLDRLSESDIYAKN